MSGISGVIQATLQHAQAIGAIAADLPDSLPTVFLDTAAALALATIGDDATSVLVAGAATENDGGAGLYIRSSVAGPGTGLVQSADGQWWQLVSLSSIFLNTAAVLAAASVGTAVTDVLVAGTTAVGDGGAGMYIRSSTPGPGTGLVQSLDGQWWLLVLKNAAATPGGSLNLNAGGTTNTAVFNTSVNATSKIFLQATSQIVTTLHPWISFRAANVFVIDHDANVSLSASLVYMVAI